MIGNTALVGNKLLHTRSLDWKTHSKLLKDELRKIFQESAFFSGNTQQRTESAFARYLSKKGDKQADKLMEFFIKLFAENSELALFAVGILSKTNDPKLKGVFAEMDIFQCHSFASSLIKEPSGYQHNSFVLSPVAKEIFNTFRKTQGTTACPQMSEIMESLSGQNKITPHDVVFLSLRLGNAEKMTLNEIGQVLSDWTIAQPKLGLSAEWAQKTRKTLAFCAINLLNNDISHADGFFQSFKASLQELRLKGDITASDEEFLSGKIMSMPMQPGKGDMYKKPVWKLYYDFLNHVAEWDAQNRIVEMDPFSHPVALPQKTVKYTGESLIQFDDFTVPVQQSKPDSHPEIKSVTLQRSQQPPLTELSLSSYRLTPPPPANPSLQQRGHRPQPSAYRNPFLE